MRSFVEWIEHEPFYIRDAWDDALGKFIGPGRMHLQPVQRRILDHCLTPNENGELPYSTILYGTTKKSGKSAIGAAINAWYACEALEGTEQYVLAADKDQAKGRILRDLKYHYRKYNASLKGSDAIPVKITADLITFPNDTFIQAIASDYASSAGSRHALTTWDELWTFTSESQRRLWDELTIIPTVPNSLRFIATYAGFINESDLLWQLYIEGVGREEHDHGRGEKIPGLEDLPCWRNGRLFTYWNHVPTMPWQTPQYYADEMISLRPAAYLRFHENRWVTSKESFIPMEWWDRATTKFDSPAEYRVDDPYRSGQVFIGVDGSIKHDCTAVVGGTYDQKRGKYIQLFHKIWTPRPGDPLDLDNTLGAYLEDRCRMFNVVKIGFDPSWILQLMLKLKGKGLPVEEFYQTPKNMVEASQAFYDLLKFENYEAYPDDEVRSHILNTVAQEEGRGFRLVKDRNRTSSKPMDFSIAAAISTYLAVKVMARYAQTVIEIESPFSDMCESKPDMRLPFQFREE